MGLKLDLYDSKKLLFNDVVATMILLCIYILDKRKTDQKKARRLLFGGMGCSVPLKVKKMKKYFKLLLVMFLFAVAMIIGGVNGSCEDACLFLNTAVNVLTLFMF